jgi:hypothetical protein
MTDFAMGFVFGMVVWHGVVKAVQLWNHYDKERHIQFNCRSVALRRSLKKFNVFDV